MAENELPRLDLLEGYAPEFCAFRCASLLEEDGAGSRCC